MTATQSAVLVLVPEADLVVGAHRQRFDRAASLGVPAHVTVLFPFVDPAEVDDVLVERLAAAVRRTPAFDCTFRSCAWFGDDVLWLAPEPQEPFRALTEAVFAEFPQCPPYEGAFADVVPHLTVGHAPHGTPPDLRAAEEAVAPRLPVTTRVERAFLLAGSDQPDSWQVLHELPLGAP